MEGSAKETVIIVHGTWAAPEAGASRWYQPVEGVSAGEGFVSKLDAALQERGSPARCWAHCTHGDQIFKWSGENSWIARTRSASALGDYVTQLRNEGWRCHIVAHSHGGNVLVEALPQIIAVLGRDEPHGKLVTLGTPFMDTMSPILEWSKRRYKIINVVSWIAFVFLIFAAAFAFFIHPVAGLVFGVFIGLFLLGTYLGRRKRRIEQGGVWTSLDEAGQTEAQLLAISSLVDEAWQILHHLNSIHNPMAVGANLPVYLFASVRSAVSQSAVVARIHGAKSYGDLGKIGKLGLGFIFTIFGFLALSFASVLLLSYMEKPTELTSDVMMGLAIAFMSIIVLMFMLVMVFTKLLGENFFSALLWPFRRSAQVVGSLASIFSAMVTYGVRYSGWSVLLKMVLGLESYRFKVPLIKQHPSNIPKKFIKYEDMPMGAEQRALDKRRDWVARHLGDVSQTFSKLVITTADISSLLYMVEVDQTLVHAAYYTDDECIARIADWIADKG